MTGSGVVDVGLTADDTVFRIPAIASRTAFLFRPLLGLDPMSLVASPESLGDATKVELGVLVLGFLLLATPCLCICLPLQRQPPDGPRKAACDAVEKELGRRWPSTTATATHIGAIFRLKRILLVRGCRSLFELRSSCDTTDMLALTLDAVFLSVKKNERRRRLYV